MQNGLYASFKTTKGEILINLTFDKTPGTVGNFVGLAEGNLENNFRPQGKPYYDGLIFHRVISDFMVQCGCPKGQGTGDPGYKFDDEFHPDLKHSGPGILSMANSGPGTNGSQFFITHTETSWLDGKHAVFGIVVKGQDVVDAIAQGDKIEKIDIIRVGEDAEKFNAVEAFRKFEGSREARLGAQKMEAEQLIQKLTEGFDKTASGLFYKVTQKGNDKKPQKGSSVSVHYKGMLTNGTVFDSSFERNQPITFKLGIGQVIPGWDEGISLMNEGDEARLVIPSNLAYGSRGAGGVIPPNATLVFDVKLVGIK